MSGGRPRAATAAALLLLAAAVFGAAQAITEFAALRYLANGRKIVSSQLGPEMTGYVTSTFKSNATFAAVIGLAAVTVCLLVVPLLRGRRWARKTTWVVAPFLAVLQLILFGGDSGTVHVGAIISDSLAQGSHERAMEITRHLVAAWYAPLHFMFEAAVTVPLIAAAVLLGRNDVRDFFAREAEAEDERLWWGGGIRAGSGPADN